jgi:peptidoglycan/xylan/chitin deacetylase (PgdA/CDA1 family)
MKKSLENMAQILALTGTLGGGAEAMAEGKQPAPHELMMPKSAKELKAALPVVLPDAFREIAAADRVRVATAALRGTENYFGNQTNLDETFGALPPATQQTLSKTAFERTRLSNVIVRNTLLQLKDILSPEQAKDFQVVTSTLQKQGMGVSTFESAAAWAKGTKREQLFKIYHEINALLQGQHTVEVGVAPAVAQPPQPREAVQAPPVEVLQAQAPAMPTIESLQLLDRRGSGNETAKKYYFSEGSVKEIEGHPTINLTFDDGPDTTWTPRVLDILAKHKVKATFYLQGANIRPGTEAVIRRIQAEGHEIALHSFDHHDMKKASEGLDGTFAKQVTGVEQQLDSVGVKHSKLYRPPYGSITQEQIQYLGEHGYKVVNWSIDTFDWDKLKNDSDRMTLDVLNGAQDRNGDPKGGKIVLMHSAGGNRANTLEALPKIILALKEKGYTMVTTSTILGLEKPLVGAPRGAVEEQAKPYEVKMAMAGSLTAIPDVTPPTTPIAEAPEALPQKADGFDKLGKPYGWGLQKYRYVEQDLPFTADQLSPVFNAVELNGKQKPVQLDRETYQAWYELVTEFNTTVPKGSELSQMGLYITEGLRTFKEQDKLRKKFGTIAAMPGESEHQIGTAFDLRNGNNQEMYNWFMEYQQAARDSKFVPRAVRHGFIPTVPKESWHFRYVGKEAAVKFWQKHRVDILNNHTRLLRTEWVAPKNT